jgi:hypothetical protein
MDARRRSAPIRKNGRTRAEMDSFSSVLSGEDGYAVEIAVDAEIRCHESIASQEQDAASAL